MSNPIKKRTTRDEVHRMMALVDAQYKDLEDTVQISTAPHGDRFGTSGPLATLVSTKTGSETGSETGSVVSDITSTSARSYRKEPTPQSDEKAKASGCFSFIKRNRREGVTESEFKSYFARPIKFLSSCYTSLSKIFNNSREEQEEITISRKNKSPKRPVEPKNSQKSSFPSLSSFFPSLPKSMTVTVSKDRVYQGEAT